MKERKHNTAFLPCLYLDSIPTLSVPVSSRNPPPQIPHSLLSLNILTKAMDWNPYLFLHNNMYKFIIQHVLRVHCGVLCGEVHLLWINGHDSWGWSQYFTIPLGLDVWAQFSISVGFPFGDLRILHWLRTEHYKFEGLKKRKCQIVQRNIYCWTYASFLQWLKLLLDLQEWETKCCGDFF